MSRFTVFGAIIEGRDLGTTFAIDDGTMSRMAGAERSTSRSVKLTYDDFLQFPDDGMRHELIDGEHFVTRLRIRGTSGS
jgi:hypothetical protein